MGHPRRVYARSSARAVQKTDFPECEISGLVLGPLLAIHFGIILALFIVLPYCKFVHGIYRYVALVRYARERPMMPKRGAAE